MPDYTQNKFYGGEISETAHARTEIRKYPESVYEMLNFFCHAHGAASNRPGMEYIAPPDTDTGKVRIEPFVYNVDDTYCMVITEFAIRFIRQDSEGDVGYVVYDEPITDIGEDTGPGDDIIQTTSNHGLAVDDYVYYTDASGKSYFYFVETVPAADELTLKDRDGASVSLPSSYTSETLKPLVTVTTPYQDGDISLLDFKQKSNTVTISHRDYKQRELTRSSHTNWTISTVDVSDLPAKPTGLSYYTTSKNDAYFYKFNNILDTFLVISDITATNPVQITFEQRTWTGARIAIHATTPIANGVGCTVTTASAHGYATGDQVTFENIQGMTELNGNTYTITVATTTTFTLDGIDSTGYGTHVPSSLDQFSVKEGGVPVVSRKEDNFYEDRIICFSGCSFTGGGATAMAAKVNSLNLRLSNRVDLSESKTRFDLYYLSANAVDASALTITGYTEGSGQFGSQLLKYRVTAVDHEGQESFPTDDVDPVASDSLGDDRWCSLAFTAPSGYNVSEYNIYKQNLGSNTVYGFIGIHDVSNGEGEPPYFNDVNIAPELADNPPEFPVRNPFSIDIEAAGIANLDPVSINSENHGLAVGERVIIDGGDHAEFADGIYFVRAVTDDDNFTIEDADGVGIDGSAWVGSLTTGGTVSDYPCCSVYHKQRRGFASKFNRRQRVDFSATGLHSFFTKSSDAFSYDVDVQDEIRAMLSGSDLLLFTSGSVILVSTDGPAFAFDTIDNIEQQAAGIAAGVPPLKMRNSLIYVQAKRSKVFDLAYTFDQNSYRGQDLTILVPHFIDAATIVSWSYQSVPEPIVWCIMSNGNKIGLTYERDNNIFGWHGHKTDALRGQYKDICVVPEGADEVDYYVTERFVNGSTRQFIERAWNRKFSDSRDTKFVDCFVTLDAPITITNITEESSTDAVKVTAAGHGLVDDDLIEIGDVVGATELNNDRFKAAEVTTNDFYLVSDIDGDTVSIVDITASGTDVVVEYDNSLNTDIKGGDVVRLAGTGVTDSVASIDDLWFYASGVTSTPPTFKLTQFDGTLYDNTSPGAWTGLSAGAVGTVTKGTIVNKDDISAYISDGVVRKCVTSLSGFDHLEGEDIEGLADGFYVDGLTVSSGSVTLPDAACRVHLGLGYTARIKGLPLDTPESTFSGRVRSLIQTVLKLYRTRGVKAGPDTDTLHEMKQREEEGFDEVTEMLTGETIIDFEPSEANRGQYVIQQDYPLPVTVQAVGLNMEVGDE